jgi:hypothetical protein
MYFKNNDLNYNINKLPKETALYITSYLYEPQPKSLLEDIKHFSSSLKFVKNIYRHVFFVVEADYNHAENEDLNWLINNMFIYANDRVATMNGYVPKFINIFYRNIILRLICPRSRHLENYIKHKFEKKPVSVQIKIMWGLFLIEERNECIYEWLKMFELSGEHELLANL